MSLKFKKNLLVGSTIVLIMGLNFVFAYFLKSKDQAVQNTFVENQLKGDAKSILAHFYKFGNTTWFNDVIESYKKLGIPCLSVSNTNNEVISKYGSRCDQTIWAEDYTKQKILKIDYSLPTLEAMKTFRDNIDLFTLVFLAELMILIPFVFGLKMFFREHYTTLLEKEKSIKDAEIKESTIKKSRILSHNIMPTISSLKTLIFMLSGKIDGKESQILDEVVTNLENTSNQLLGRDIKNDLIPFNLAEQLKDIVSVHNIEFKNEIYLRFFDTGSALYILGDRFEFKLIIANLIKNAFEAHSNKIVINVNRVGDDAIISLKDDGIGISKDALSKMFEYGASFNKKNGNGIGLHHAHKSISKWRGKMSASNNSDRGANIVISLPILGKKANTKIVLIDDSKLMHLNWKGAGKKIGIEVQPYYSFAEFEKNSSAYSKFTSIFIDYDLNGENGIDFAYRIKEMGFTEITLVTGYQEKISEDFPQFNKNFPFEKLLIGQNPYKETGVFV